MQFTDNDTTRLLSFYDELISLYGPDDARGEGWSNAANKMLRFQVLSEVGNMNGSSILDVGCGFGDLYAFLSKRYPGIEYRGIDINPKMIDVARKKNSDARFEVADFGKFSANSLAHHSSPLANEGWDFVLASGSFSFKIPDYQEIYFSYIQKMFELSRRAAAFNLLNRKYHIDDDTYAAYLVPEVYEFCSGLTKKLIIRQEYLDHDFTVYLYR